MSQTPLDKLKNVDWRGLVKTATNKVKQYTLNLSPLEIMVEDATNRETWGPHGSVMSDIADACFDPEGYRQVFGVLARRLQETGENWRMCYKALLLLEFLVKQGPAKVADDVAASASVLDRLTRFQYKDANGKDHGANVRHRAQEISALVSDPARVREEREKARANKAKYTGVSAAEMRSGASGFGSSGGYSGGSGRRFDPASLVRPGQPTPGSTSFSSSSSSYSGGGGGYSGGGGGGSGGLGGRTYTGGGGSAGYVGYGSGGGSRGASGPASPSAGSGRSSDAARADALEATRARIEKLRAQQGTVETVDHGDKHAHAKKKLTDVKVNPKIAASLGLKPVTAPPRPAAASVPSGGYSAASTVSAAPEIDLLGGLDDPEPAPAAAAAPAAAVAAVDDAGGWDAFSDAAAAAPAAPVADPFAILEAAPVSAVPVAAAAPAPAPAAAAGHAMPVPTRGALPEDLFADLTGLDLNKPQEPMGVKSPSAVSPGAAAAPAPGADPFGFADFSAAPVAPAAPVAAAPAAKDPFSDLLG